MFPLLCAQRSQVRESWTWKKRKNDKKNWEQQQERSGPCEDCLALSESWECVFLMTLANDFHYSLILSLTPSVYLPNPYPFFPLFLSPTPVLSYLPLFSLTCLSVFLPSVFFISSFLISPHLSSSFLLPSPFKQPSVAFLIQDKKQE